MIEPLPSLPLHDVVLFIPPATIERKTARMFAALDALPFEPGRAAEKLASGLPRSVTPGDLSNTFERVAWEIFPGLDRLRRAVEECIASAVRMAGAGPTLFWIGPPGNGRRVAAAAAGLDCTVIPTSTAAPR
jgi:4-diphosphocytidyl-2-C-methyl-D-erythritol kinase